MRKRATSPATKTSSVTMPYMLKARQPASQATPRGPAASPDWASHSVLRIAPKATTAMSASIRAGGGDLGAGEARANHQHAPGAGIKPFGQTGRVFTGAQSEYAVERGLVHVRPGSGPGAGRDQQPVEG